MWIVEVCIHRPVFTVMLTFALVGLGLIGFQGLGVDLFPRVEFPYVSITTRMDGASPETMETEVTDVIEGYINNISGIEKLRSVSSEGVSQITIEFKLDEDADIKAQEVRDKVSLARSELPVDAELSLINVYRIFSCKLIIHIKHYFFYLVCSVPGYIQKYLNCISY